VSFFIDGWILLYLKNSDEFLAEEKSDKNTEDQCLLGSVGRASA
jgi:hypothetical protein